MIPKGVTICPKCGGSLKYYGMAPRIVRTKGRATTRIKLRRLKCCECGSLHRELPRAVFPYKQYEAEVITGVCDGFITPEVLGFEDYPCETTMLRWVREFCKSCYGEEIKGNFEKPNYKTWSAVTSERT